MTDVELRDQAVAHLRKTTIPYPKWAARAPRKTDMWTKAFAALAQIGTSADLSLAAVELKLTTASYPGWIKSVEQGAYDPPDGSTTHWGKAFTALERIGSSATVGAKLRAIRPPLTGLRLVDYTGKPDVTSTLSDDGSSKGNVRYLNAHRVGGTHDGFKAGGGAKRIVYEFCTNRSIQRADQSKPEGDHNSVMGFSCHRGPEDIYVLGGESSDLGTSKFSHGSYFGSVKRGLVASHWFHDFGTNAIQAYPGEGIGVDLVVVSSLLGIGRASPRRAMSVAGESGHCKVLVANTIFLSDVLARGDAEIEFVGPCVVPPQFKITAESGAVIRGLSNVLRIDPKMVGGKATAPELRDAADPEWLWDGGDYQGNPWLAGHRTIGAAAS